MEPLLQRLEREFEGSKSEKSLIFAGEGKDRKFYSVKIEIIWGKKNLLKETFPQFPISIQKRKGSGKSRRVVWTKKDVLKVVPRTWEQHLGKIGAHVECRKETGKFLQWFMRRCKCVS